MYLRWFQEIVSISKRIYPLDVLIPGNTAVTYYEIESIYGHDTFLLDLNNIGAAVKVTRRITGNKIPSRLFPPGQFSSREEKIGLRLWYILSHLVIVSTSILLNLNNIGATVRVTRRVENSRYRGSRLCLSIHVVINLISETYSCLTWTILALLSR